MIDHVFIGASFPSVRMIQEAVIEGFSSQIIWGRDYPHPEGTWQYADNPEMEQSTTRLALRHVFAGVPREQALAMAGRNGTRVYGLDDAELMAVARRIGAPTWAELDQPLEAIPEVHPHSRAFRGMNSARLTASA
jgi:hypothetical protein